MNPVIAWTIGIVLTFAAAAFLGPQIYQRQNQPIQLPAARQLATVTKAARDYMVANSSTLDAAAAAAPNNNVAVTTNTLQSAGLLDPDWRDIGPFGQTHVLIVHRVSSGILQGLVASVGGDIIPDTTLRDLALHGPDEAGYIASDTPTIATSASGQWTYNLAQFAVQNYALEPGHFTAAIFLNGSQLIAPFLSRFAIAGHPEATTMSADANWGGHSLTNASDVALATGQKLSAAAFGVGAFPDGTILTKPTCPQGTTPQIMTAIAKVGSNGLGQPMTGFYTDAADLGTSWKINIVYQSESGQNHTTTNFGKVPTFVYCQ